MISGGTLYTRIFGTGSYLPEQIRTNADLERMVDTSDEWIVTRTGIRERRIAAPGETAADMGTIAAQKALDASGISANEIDVVICATTSSSHAFPSTSCQIANAMGIASAMSFDLAAACAGFSYAYHVAHAMIISGLAEKILIIGTDALSRCCDPADRTTIVLFGDGAGACVLGRSDEPGTLVVHSSTEPQSGELLKLGYVDRALLEPEYIKMRGNEVFKRAVTVLSSLVTKTLESAHMKPSELDFLVPHQANLRIITATARKLQLDMDHVIVTLDKQGNTSSASVILALDEGIRSGRIKRGMNLLLESFGGGFTWSSALIRY